MFIKTLSVPLKNQECQTKFFGYIYIDEMRLLNKKTKSGT